MLKLGQRVVAVHRQHQRVGTQDAADQTGVFHQLRRRGDIDPVFVQRFEHLLGVADIHRHFDLRQAFAKGLDQIEDVIRRSRGNAQRTAALATVAQKELNVGFLLQQRLDHRQQAHAFVAEGQTPAAAVEQLHGVVAFEVADLRGHGRLAQPELFCGLRNTAQLGHPVKRFQLGTQHSDLSCSICAAGANR